MEVWVGAQVLSPLQIHLVVKHVVEFQNLPLEILSFLLTLLAATVTPVFVLSKRWTHLPCGCIINCTQNTFAVTSDGEKSKSGYSDDWKQFVCNEIHISGPLTKLPK